MEMSIDEAISWLVSIAEHAGQDDISIYDEDAVAIEIAMNTMRKYQKIEEILDQLIDSKIRTYDAVMEIEDIVYGQTEVEDGNDD